MALQTDIFQFQGMWYWKHGDECSPEAYFYFQNAKMVARWLFPRFMLVVHK
jgi:hypothetical protein